MEPWYVLFTKPLKERVVHDRLAKQGIEVYLPFYPLMRTSSRAPRPLFPRYLFARWKADTLAIDTIRWTPGLVSILRFGEEYARVPDEIIAHIQRRIAELGDLKQIPFQLGQRVRFRDGHPLAKLEAIFERPCSDAKRACVLLEILGRLTRCEVEFATLEPVEKASLELHGVCIAIREGR